ncbi:LacI family DNA-binding transcriptional regulator [Brevibacillus dissolubilis]|uniref:LacI family DNA-binding transcriptional regulator n=1 Tax=Brevibacillus dissolubilis TaxID=1844116 RepID=UPI001116D714|nr:LacI family DNA-binding transcriptional regulator [Brevibacillus dissolubilis]
MKITIKDIAKLAGVSPATVSKIINNYEDVGEATRKRVLEIMEQQGYRPTYSAQTLATKKSNLIGVIFAGKVNVDFNNPFFIEIMNSFKKTIGGLGYDLLFFSNEQFHAHQEDYLARCRYYQVDGCIIINGDEIEPSIHDLDASEIPCIGVDIVLSGNKSGYLMTDNYKVSSKVVEHFYLLGHREIAHIGGNPNAVIAGLRTDGFRQSLREYGLTVREDWIVHGEDFFEESGYRAMKKLLGGEELPQAVFAASDLMAFGAIRAIKESGLRIPEDVAIIGCDDIDACRYIDPPLTTVRQDKVKMGKLAAYMLSDLIDGKMESSAVMVEPELAVRKTCGAR